PRAPATPPSFPTRRSSDLAGRRAPEGLREDGVAALVAAGAGLDVLVLAGAPGAAGGVGEGQFDALRPQIALEQALGAEDPQPTRSEEHTSELQSRFDLVCR